MREKLGIPTDEEKALRIKLDEMRFQYQSIESNYSRLINKCSFAMMGICAILGGIIGFQGRVHSLFLWTNIPIVIAIILLMVSLCFLFVIHIHYIQPLVSHRQIEQDSSSCLLIVKKLNASYSNMLTRLKNEVTHSQSNYKVSLTLLVCSIILTCFHFFCSHLLGK